MIAALGLSGVLLAGCNFQGPNTVINQEAGTYEKQQLFQLYAAAGGTMSYDEWLESVRGADGASLLADRRNPTDADGKNGDVFINIETWDIFLKVGGSWGPAGNIKGEKGDKGDKGDQGEQGPQGLPGKDGADGKDGKDGQDGQNGQDGKDGQNGQDGKDGVGIKEVKKTGNDGYNDIYTIFLTDDSSYDFKIPNRALSMEIENERLDNKDQPYPYYVGTSAKLNVTVTVEFADGSEEELDDEDFQVTGFDLSAVGAAEATIKFGPLSETFAYQVADISAEMSAQLALEDDTLVDTVPGLASGVYDYQLANGQLLIVHEETITTAEAIAMYQAQLTEAGWTDNGTDSYGDKHFKSPHGELDACAWNYYDVAVIVDFKNIKPFPTPEGATKESIMWDILSQFYTTYTWDDLVGYQVISVGENQVSAYIGFGSGSSSYFGMVLDTVEAKLPKYLVADGERYNVTYSGSTALVADYLSTDGAWVVEIVAYRYNSKLYADIYVLPAPTGNGE